MNIAKYLKRIKVNSNLKIDITTLRLLHRSHVYSIPFENLDIHLDRSIELNIESIYHKVITNGRGGFCYELNYLFYSLLHELGFDCSMISSSIFNNEGNLGPEFDHMSILIHLEENWLIDVGYGDLFIEPLKIKDKITIKDKFKFYKIDRLDQSSYLLSVSQDGKEFTNRYEFDLKPRKIEEFHDQCIWKQQSPESHFVLNKLCTIPTDRGRITLLNNKLIQHIDDQRTEVEIDSEGEFNKILKEKFAIDL